MHIHPIAWAEKHFYFDSSSSSQGTFRISRAPWLADIMSGFADPLVKRGICRCSAQSGKTQTGMILACWSLAEDPGPFMWVMPAADEAKTFSTTRLRESIERCEPLMRLAPKNPNDFSKLEIKFATAPLILVGAGSDSKISGKPIRYLFIDEEKNMKPGQVSKAEKRVRSKWDCKIWRMSTSDHEDDSIDQAFKEGDQRHWHVMCPKCAKAAPLQFRQLKYEAEELVIKSIHYECPTCYHRWLDVPSDREWISSQGEWVAHNPLSNREDRSWTWNALLPRWNAWRDIVTEWLRAQRALAIGDKYLLRVFCNETICEPWKEEFSVDKPEIKTFPYSIRDYASGETLENEKLRFATIDRGKGHWWLCIRAWRADGSSRLLLYELIPTFERLVQTIERYKVNVVLQDCGFEKDKVLRECADNKWIAVHGAPAVDSFPHTERNAAGQKTREIRRLFSDFIHEKIGGANPVARVMNLATQRLKDITDNLRKQRGPLWEVPSDIGGVYLNQLTKEGKELVNDGRERWQEGVSGNHAWDTEVYQTAAAIVWGCLTA